MAKTYVPSSDADFDRWLAEYTSALAAHRAEVGLSDADAATLEALKTLWDEKFAANNAAWIAAKRCAAAKTEVRKAIEQVLGSQVPRIQAYEGTSDELRRSFGLKLRGESADGYEFAVNSKPKPEIDRNELLTHKVTVYTVTADGMQSRKPAGTMGCEVRRAIGTAPASAEEMEVVGVMPGTKFSIKYPGTEVGKQVTYAMRWISRTGEPGAWSDFQSATIAA